VVEICENDDSLFELESGEKFSLLKKQGLKNNINEVVCQN
jgi:hypothetical protein